MISHRYTSIPILLNLPPTSHPTPPHPSRLSQSKEFELPESHSKFPLAIYFTYGVYVSMLRSPYIPPAPSSPHPCRVPRSGLYVRVSMAALANRFIRTIFLDSIYMC